MSSGFSWSKVLGTQEEAQPAATPPAANVEAAPQPPTTPNQDAATPAPTQAPASAAPVPVPEAAPVQPAKETTATVKPQATEQPVVAKPAVAQQETKPAPAPRVIPDAADLNKTKAPAARPAMNTISTPTTASRKEEPTLPDIDVQKQMPPAFQDGNVIGSEELREKHGLYIPIEVPLEVRTPQLSKSPYDKELTPDVKAKRSAFVVTDNEVQPVGQMHIDDILRMALERKASDVHLTVGLPPMIRQDGEIVPLAFLPLEPEDTRRLVYETLTDDNLRKFEETHELDFAYSVKDLARFRFNVYVQRGAVAGALRAIPTKIPSFEQLRLPGVIREMAKRTSGLVLVTGPTGSGKSTTIASMIDDINENRTSHILTIEDPIEYLHIHKKCMVNQRELHSDTYSFHNALRAVLREDPDIILVGELRDLETIEAALTLAETGHLVFGTLHTRNAPSTIDRVIDVFPSEQQDQIRVLLGNTLEGVVSQQLLPRLGGGRVASIEVMLGTPAVKNLIREGKTHQMYSVLETSGALGMQTMDASLAELFRNGFVSYEECLMRAIDKETFARLAKVGNGLRASA